MSCSLFQAMMHTIDALSTCVRHVCTFEEAPDLAAIRSLPAYVLKILKETFRHCKVSARRCWEGLCLFFILQQRLLFSSFILSRPFITWDDEKTHIIFVLRRARWCTVAVCPWWLTCCRAFLRMLTPSRRVSWSCLRKCLSTAVPQKKRSLILSQVQDFACSYILSALATLIVICS